MRVTHGYRWRACNTGSGRLAGHLPPRLRLRCARILGHETREVYQLARSRQRRSRLWSTPGRQRHRLPASSSVPVRGQRRVMQVFYSARARKRRLCAEAFGRYAEWNRRDRGRSEYGSGCSATHLPGKRRRDRRHTSKSLPVERRCRSLTGRRHRRQDGCRVPAQRASLCARWRPREPPFRPGANRCLPDGSAAVVVALYRAHLRRRNRAGCGQYQCGRGWTWRSLTRWRQ